MTDGAGSAADPMPSLEALAEALSTLVAAGRDVAAASAAVMDHPGAREAVASAITVVLEGLFEQVVAAVPDNAG